MTFELYVQIIKTTLLGFAIGLGAIAIVVLVGFLLIYGISFVFSVPPFTLSMVIQAGMVAISFSILAWAIGSLAQLWRKDHRGEY